MLSVTLLSLALISAAPVEPSYAVVVSKETSADPAWKEVVDALVKKHAGQVIVFEKDVAESLPKLVESHPHFTCFVAQPKEAGRKFVAAVHQLTRKLDDDPYTDTQWGILTGYDAANALRIAQHEEPLTVHKVASGTELAMDMVPEGIWYCELEKNRMVRKAEKGEAKQEQGPDDTTKALVETLNDYQADLFVTSGHATERGWQIGFRYKNGFFRSKDGQLFGLDTAGKQFPVKSDTPKVYLPIGNCLMGHIDSTDAMALAWMNSAGVHQMMGYTVPTWFGYGGWGCLDYFVEQPGRYTFTEAFHANHHALIHCLETKAGNEKGLTYDRDTVAFYGDPAWEARMENMPKAYEQKLEVDGDTYTLTITGNRGENSFEPINTNGSQRGWRPIVEFLPQRVKEVKIIEANGLSPIVTDDFILVPNPKTYEEGKKYKVKFTARPVKP